MTATTKGISRAGLFALAGLGAAAISEVARAAAAGKVLVVVYQRGALDGMSYLVPVGDPDYQRMRAGLAQDPNSLLPISGNSFYALHPQLKFIQSLYNTGEMAFFPSVGHQDDNRSHFTTAARLETAGGQAPDPGWLGRLALATRQSTDAPLRAVTLTPYMVRSAMGTYGFASVHDPNYYVAPAGVNIPLSTIYAGQGDVGSVAVKTGQTIDAVNASVKPVKAANGAVYDANNIGWRLSQAARFIRAAVGTQLIVIDDYAYDMHVDTRTFVDAKLATLDSAYKAFKTDLGPLWANVCILTMTEFGRTVQPNSDLGTDHGWGALWTIAGGGLRQGGIYGQWPGLNQAKLVNNAIRPTMDYRQVLGEIVSGYLGYGNVLSTVLPNYSYSPLGVF